MELCCLQSFNIPRSVLAEKPFLCGQPITLIQSTSTKRCSPKFNNLKSLRSRPRTSAKISSLKPQGTTKDVKSKDGDFVFVAGATGRVGSRTVRELLKLGFNVRAGVRSAQRAQPLVKSVEQIKFENAADGGAKAIEKLEIVECDLEKTDQIRPALGDASIVICCIGASEKDIFDALGPYRIDYQATKNLIDADFLITMPTSWSYSPKEIVVLDLFSSYCPLQFVPTEAISVDLPINYSTMSDRKLISYCVQQLSQKLTTLSCSRLWEQTRKAEEALLASGLPYTIVRPGGMERPTDSFKETNNITLSEEDTLFGGLVSNLQVAELMAVMAKNRSLSYCKVVEVIAETTAPLTPMEDLLAKIPPQRVQVSPTKETGDLQKPATSSSITSEIPDASLEKKSAETKLKAATSLSPYIAYADLKPPTSPSPNPPDGRQEGANGAEDCKPTEAASSVVDHSFDKAELLNTRPLSPYTAYEDLKPPTSPSPTASGPKTSISAETAPQLAGGNDISASITTISTEKDPSHTVAYFLSPYAVYEDLKPPTSPTPSPSGPKASTTVEVTSPVNGDNDVAIDSVTNSAKEDSSKKLAFCHSPYPAYEDFKPPSSPTPSFKKL